MGTTFDWLWARVWEVPVNAGCGAISWLIIPASFAHCLATGVSFRASRNFSLVGGDKGTEERDE